ncbi:MAG: DUF2721 domain-containing protein [Telmatospirillum sp.]|nr:DUF2721 domain-containing protein [Telmatospirillum sp.]
MIPGIADNETIAHLIQVAIAPVFLLNGLGILLNVFTGRLARVVDRMRKVAAQLRADPDDADIRQLRRELALQRLRLHIVNAAIALAALSAFLTCCAILALFVGGLSRDTQSVLPLALFAAAVAAVIVGLALFIWEVRVSGRALAAETEDLK